MHLTWIVPKWPIPADDGAKQASTQLLQHLAALGQSIHLIAIVPDGLKIDESLALRELGIQLVTVVRRRPGGNTAAHIRNLLSKPFVPLTVAPYATASVARGVRAALSAWPESIVVYDGLHGAGWQLAAGDEVKVKSIYRAHNVECNIWTRAAEETSNVARKLFLRYEAALMARFEKRVAETAAIVFPVSEVDAMSFRKLAPAAYVQPLPIGISVDRVSLSPPVTRDLLFIGRLDWAPNRDGLRWFLDKVWPQVTRRSMGATLTIAGSGDGAWLDEYKGVERLRVLGHVESVAPYYQRCILAIVPLFYGSGTRVKVIEASLHGRACLSTSLGVEGIGLTHGENYYQAETVEQWVDVICSLEVAAALERGELAHRFVSEQFNPKRIARKFISAAQAAGIA